MPKAVERSGTPVWASTPVFSGAVFSNKAEQTSTSSGSKNWLSNSNAELKVEAN